MFQIEKIQILSMILITAMGAGVRANTVVAAPATETLSAIRCGGDLEEAGAKANPQLWNSSDFEFARSELQRVEAHFLEKMINHQQLIEGILIGLIVDSNVLVEGPPATAKSRTLKILGSSFEGTADRITFFGELMPSGIIGERVFNQETQKYQFYPGKILKNNFLLFDEFNRGNKLARQAVATALEERQVEVGEKRYSLPGISFILIAQNPADTKEGTELNESNITDRILLRVGLGYAEREEQDRQIMDLNEKEKLEKILGIKDTFKKVSLESVQIARVAAPQVTVSNDLKNYMVRLASVTRPNSEIYATELRRKISGPGLSPRAYRSLLDASKARAWLRGRGEVTREDIDALVEGVYGFRLKLSDQFLSEEGTGDPIPGIIQIMKKAALRAEK